MVFSVGKYVAVENCKALIIMNTYNDKKTRIVERVLLDCDVNEDQMAQRLYTMRAFCEINRKKRERETQETRENQLQNDTSRGT